MDEFNSWFDRLTGGHTWIAQVFIVVFVTLLASAVVRLLLKRIAIRADKTYNLWDDALIGALQGPARALIWVVGLTFAASIVAARTDAPIFEFVDPARVIGVIGTLSWFLVRLISHAQYSYAENKKRDGETYDRTALDAVAKLGRISVVITAVLVALQSLGFSVSGVLAFGGVGGIAVGFAARDILANLFGGLTVYLDRPFSVGDWIRSPDREIEGTVEAIGWRSTRIRTFDKRLLYVPNSVFTNISVENPSRMSHRRIKETIGVRYDDMSRVPDILSDIREMLHGHDAIDQSQTLMVNLIEFNDSSVDFFIYTFTKTTVWTEYHQIKEDVMLKIADIVARHGGEIAYPTRTLHLPDPVLVGEPAAGSALG